MTLVFMLLGDHIDARYQQQMEEIVDLTGNPETAYDTFLYVMENLFNWDGSGRGELNWDNGTQMGAVCCSVGTGYSVGTGCSTGDGGWPNWLQHWVWEGGLREGWAVGQRGFCRPAWIGGVGIMGTQ